jgi:hypothetical protein
MLKCLQVTGLKVDLQGWKCGAEKRKILRMKLDREDSNQVKGRTLRTEGCGTLKLFTA